MSNSDAREGLIHWLTQDDVPPVRYMILRDFPNSNSSPESIQKLGRESLIWPPLQKLLALQKPDGGFPSSKKTKTAETTLAALSLMARCGLTDQDINIQKTLAYINQNYLHDGVYTYRGKGSGVLPCYVGLFTRLIANVAGTQHQLFQSGIRWILDYQRFDHKTTRGGGNDQWPYKAVESYGGCWRSVSCYHGVVAALRALSVIAPENRTEEVVERIKSVIEYLRIHRVYKKSSEDRPLFRYSTRLFLFGGWRLNLLDILEGIAEADPSLINEDWVRDAVETVEKTKKEDKIVSAASYPTGLIDPDPLEKSGAPSRFLTHQWLKVTQKFAL